MHVAGFRMTLASRSLRLISKRWAKGDKVSEMSKKFSIFRFPAATMVSALVLAVSLPAVADTNGSSDDAVDCDTRMSELEELIREKDMEIPSGALNDIFTIQQQASEACIGGSDQMAIDLLDDLEETIMAAVDEGIPTVTADDVEESMEAELEEAEADTGAGLVDSMGAPEPPEGEEGFGGESIVDEGEGMDADD